MNIADITQRIAEPPRRASITIEKTLCFESETLASHGKQRIAPRLMIMKIDRVSVSPAVKNLLKIPEIRTATQANKTRIDAV